MRKRGGKGKGKDPKGKSIKGKGESKGGKTLPKVEEENRAAENHYSPRAAWGEIWGPTNHQREQSYQNNQWQNTNDWGRNDGGWKLENNSAKTNEAARNLGFGEYADWTYLEAIANKRRYVQDLIGETDIRCPEKKQRIERAR